MPKQKQSNKKRVLKKRPPRNAMGKPPSSTGQYFESLINPFAPDGECQIPDMCFLPTATYQQRDEFTFTTSAAGVGGCQLALPYGYTGGAGKAGIVFKAEDSATTTDATIVYGGSQYATSATSLFNNCAACRVVSGGIRVYSVQATNNDSGVLIAARSSRVGPTPPFSVTGLMGMPGRYHGRASNGVQGVWKPVDNADWEFRPMTDAAWAGTLQVHLSGATANATYYVEVVGNYEYLPNSTDNDSKSRANVVDVQGASRAAALVSVFPDFMPLSSAGSLPMRMSGLKL